MRSKWPKILIGLSLFLIFLMGAFRYSVFRITKNFAEVDPGRFYRSAQLTPEELEEAIDTYGIKTVISLRGAPEHAYWYHPQKDLLEKKGVNFQALWWTAEHFPPKEGLVNYLDLLKNAEYPILIHCRTGADRTGEAAALYAIEYMKEKPEEAIKKHLNFSYWHVPLFKPAMTEFVRRYEGQDWAKNKYDLCSPENRPFAENPDCPSVPQ